MTNATSTHITLILDRSGSMGDIQDDIIGGVNAFFATQAAQPGPVTATLVQFDGQDPFELLADNVPVAEVRPLSAATYVPRADTPLLDAIGNGIHRLEKQLAALPAADRPGGIVFVIVTDGMENASRKFTRAHIADLIKAKQSAGWEFVFLSSDLSAVQEARGFNVDVDSSIRFSKRQTRESLEMAAEKVVVYHQSRGKVKFSDADRKRADDGA